jgi:hypothetical protein
LLQLIWSLWVLLPWWFKCSSLVRQKTHRITHRSTSGLKNGRSTRKESTMFCGTKPIRHVPKFKFSCT